MTNDPKWLTIARGELGVREYTAFRPGPKGASSNPRIEEYQRAANGREDDDVPWCSSFVNWCMKQAGLPGTDRGAARSWLRWGVPLQEPRPGCVVVLWRESRESYKGHVGLYARTGQAPDSVALIGGNQMNAVRVASFPSSRVLAYRWPSEAMLAAMPAIH
jgi:uncharacterized protein (TIGR02594 family)